MQVGSPVPLRWYALRVRSNHEWKVTDSLRTKGFEHLLPVYRIRRRWSDRMREVEQPLFAGYVFSRFLVDHRQPILTIPGVIEVVGSGRHPVPIDDGEMQALERMTTAMLAAEPWPYLRVGDAVRVDRGPLAGLDGRLTAFRKPARLVLSVTLLQRAVAVEIDEHWVTPIRSSWPDTRVSVS